MVRPVLPGITPPFLVMMMRELEELTARINTIAAITNSEQFETVNEWTAHLVVAQMAAMQAYAAILGLRINAYQQTPVKPASLNG